MNLLDELKERGLISNITNNNKVENFFKQKNLAVYVGFDPTAKSLHLGNYVMISLLKRFKLNGFKTIALVGGATGIIGDPSGKSSERNLLDIEVVKKNILSIQKQLIKFTEAEIFNNAVLYSKMNVLDYLREVGKSINVNHILERDIVKKRLEVGISYTEFSYSIIQGYDFYWLYKNKNVALQMGGSDQWSNITAGVDYIRRTIGDENNACGITINLLTKSDGTKFGKSEKGAIYLDKSLTSPYEMYQFLINQSDSDVKKLLFFFSFKSLDEIKSILEDHEKNPSQKIAQKMLAKEIVTTIHGEKEFAKVMQISQYLFELNFDKLSLDNWNQVKSNMNCFEFTGSAMNIVDLLVTANIVESKRIARELISTKAIYVNNKLVESEDVLVSAKEGYFQKYSLIRKGKKNYFMIEWK